MPNATIAPNAIELGPMAIAMKFLALGPAIINLGQSPNIVAPMMAITRVMDRSGPMLLVGLVVRGRG
jgi:hypothetical protein